MTIQQYHDIKNNYPNAILLFRIGNDYMALNQDAEIISKLLNTTIHNNNSQHTKRHTIKQFKQNTLIKFINKLKITKNPHFTSKIDKMG